jgi:hypothetical protein
LEGIVVMVGGCCRVDAVVLQFALWAGKLEQALLSTNPPDKQLRLCAQWVRERFTFVSTDFLDRHQIPYTVERQRPGEVMITAPDAYHQVLNSGPNLAEAVNFVARDVPLPCAALDQQHYCDTTCGARQDCLHRGCLADPVTRLLDHLWVPPPPSPLQSLARSAKRQATNPLPVPTPKKSRVLISRTPITPSRPRMMIKILAVT